MADKNNIVYKKGIVPRSPEFQSTLKLKGETLAFIEDTLEATTESAFAALGFRKSDKSAGIYGDEKAYGMGAATGFFNVKIGGQTETMMEKHITFGAKRMSVEIHVFIHPNSETLDMRYKTTEASALRGYASADGPMMINQQLHFDLKNMEKFKKEFKEKMDDYASREAAYMSSTKLGTEDPIEKSTASMVDESSNMSINDILSSDDDLFFGKLHSMFGVHEAFSIAEEKEEEEDLILGGDDIPKMTDDEIKKAAANHVLEDDELEEVTAAGGAGSAGGFGYDAPFGKMSKRKFSETEFGKRQRLKESPGNWAPMMTEGDDGFWKVVSQDTLNRYKSDHIMGAPGAEDIEVNSESEEQYNSGGVNKFPQGKSFKDGDFEKHNTAIKEAEEAQKKSIQDYLSIDPSVRKKWNREEIVSESARKDRWERLSTFVTNETIKRAEDRTTPKEVIAESTIKKVGEEAEKPLTRNQNIDEGDYIDGKKVIKVSKKNSLYNIEYLVHEEDYLNENKAYIHDYTTGNLINNPNYHPKG